LLAKIFAKVSRPSRIFHKFHQALMEFSSNCKRVKFIAQNSPGAVNADLVAALYQLRSVEMQLEDANESSDEDQLLILRRDFVAAKLRVQELENTARFLRHGY
jgi:hypothetical protein